VKRTIVTIMLFAVAGAVVAGQPQRCDGTPAVVSGARARYTPEGRRAGVEGDVVLDVVFRRSGRPVSAVVVKGLPFGLDDSAAKAVTRWKFEPPRVQGHRAQCISSVRVPFRLAERPK